MFNWLKKKKKKPSPKEEFNGNAVASMQYVVGKDGVIYLEFFWDEEASTDACEVFASLFSQINSSELMEESMMFIKDTLDSRDESDKYITFHSAVLELQRAKIEPLLASMVVEEEEIIDEVVVKPTDLTPDTFGGNQS
tara:strand:- start:1777 stop:2190 length:414 start_codon:yes stop_codon:yes gene_type:complete